MYKAYTAFLKEGKVSVPAFCIKTDLSGSIGEIIARTRSLLEDQIFTNYISKGIPLPEDISDPKPSGAIQTLIDIDLTQFETLSKEALKKEEIRRAKYGMDCNENCIEWTKGDKIVAFTFTQQKMINKVEAMSKKNPDLVKILIRNADGSIYGKMPIKALHLFLTEKREFSEEERAEARERFLKIRKEKEVK